MTSLRIIMASPRCLFRCFLLFFLVFFLLMLIVGFQVLSYDEADDLMIEELPHEFDAHQELSDDGIAAASKEDIPHPVMLWWTPFTHEHTFKKCGEVQCFVTNDRHYKNHQNTQVFLYYGTNMDFTELPLPRQPHHQWALLHEESPKNVFMYSHPEVMELFNHTSTFKRESDFPITTQALDEISSLEGTKYLVPTSEKNRLQEEEGLALINYVHSDCGTHSDRDTLITMIQRELKVDSFGSCLHNKDLPKHLAEPIGGMDHEDFYKFQAQYKFSFATENAVCDDYITEKLWRALMVGSVPVVLGSPKIRDFLPTNHSAILVSDFKTTSDLIKYLNYLNENDDEYEKYLSFKTKDGVSNRFLRKTMLEREWAINNDWTRPNFISSFECFICQRLHENKRRRENGQEELQYQADVSHYGCPKPRKFSDNPPGNLDLVEVDWWSREWVSTSFQAKALKELLAERGDFTEDEFHKRTGLIMYKEQGEKGWL